LIEKKVKGSPPEKKHCLLYLRVAMQKGEMKSVMMMMMGEN
jgi:hypothetical protein